MSRTRAPLLVMLLFASCVVVAAHADEPNAVYDKNCALCHQKGGAGVSGQFPRLAGRVGAIAVTDAGRRYLLNVVLFGMAGQVEVDRVPIVGAMPSFATLSDDDLASVLNYVTHLDGAGQKQDVKPSALSAADVAGARAAPKLSATQVNQVRDSVPGLKAVNKKGTR
jgi:mono/diheme cytochrome c family protein